MAITSNSLIEQQETCGKYARFKVPEGGCPSNSDIINGVRSSTTACEKFFTLVDREQKTRKTYKDSGLTATDCSEAISAAGKPVLLVKNPESFRIAESPKVAHPAPQKCLNEVIVNG